MKWSTAFVLSVFIVSTMVLLVKCSNDHKEEEKAFWQSCNFTHNTCFRVE